MSSSPDERTAPRIPEDQLGFGFTVEDAVHSYEGADSANDRLRPLANGIAGPHVGGRRLVGLRLENFKGFKEIDVSLSDFNLLVGSNNSGKSTILQAIKLGDTLLRLHFPDPNSTAFKKGRTFPLTLLPVAEPRDLWYQNRWRAGNSPVMARIGLRFSGGINFDFGLRLLYGAVNSRVLDSPTMLSLEDLQRVKDVVPVLVPSSFGVVTHEERRTLARVTNLIQTGRQNEAVRNTLHELYLASPERFEMLQSLLKQHFNVDLHPSVFDDATDQFIDSRYTQGGANLDIFSAGAGLLQVIQLLGFILHGNHDLVMLDEPDAHLHSSMQLIVVDMLESLAREDDFQVLISTHSKEIINFVSPTALIPVSVGASVGPLEPHDSAVAVLEEMGAIDNIDLYSLFTSKRCCFVEGKSDKTILARIAAKIGSTVFEGDSRTVVVQTGGVDNFAPAAAVQVFSKLAGVDLAHFSLRDRDGLPNAQRDALLQKGGNSFFIHQLDCIESYLVLPRAFHAIIVAYWEKRGYEGEPPHLSEIEGLVDEATAALKNSALDHVANALDTYYSREERRHLLAGELNKEAREWLEAAWSTLETRLSLVPGKRLLAMCRERVKERYGTTLTDAAIVDAAEEPDLKPLIDLVRRCEQL